MNVLLAGPSAMRAIGYAAAALASIALMTACGANEGDEAKTTSAPQQESAASAEESVAADDAMSGDEATGQVLSDEESDVDIFAYAYASGKDPKPTWEIQDQVVEFTFPAGAIDDKSSYDCLIAVNVFAGDHPDWDLRMTYPDGSVLCSEMEV